MGGGGFELGVTNAAQLASRAIATTIAPVVETTAVAQIATMGAAPDDVDERLPAEIIGDIPGCGLVYPHQRSVDYKPSLHSQVEGDLERFDRVVAAVGITRVVGFTHAANKMFKSAAVGHGSGKGEEDEITAGYESVRYPAGREGDALLPSERRLTDSTQGGNIEKVVFTETRGPSGKVITKRIQDVGTAFELDTMTLAVVEADCLDLVKAVECPRKADGGILAAREQDKSGFSHGAVSADCCS